MPPCQQVKGKSTTDSNPQNTTFPKKNFRTGITRLSVNPTTVSYKTPNIAAGTSDSQQRKDAALSRKIHNSKCQDVAPSNLHGSSSKGKHQSDGRSRQLEPSARVSTALQQLRRQHIREPRLSFRGALLQQEDKSHSNHFNIKGMQTDHFNSRSQTEAASSRRLHANITMNKSECDQSRRGQGLLYSKRLGLRVKLSCNKSHMFKL